MSQLTAYRLWLISTSAEAAGPIFQKLPSFLAQNRYQEPKDNTKGPFQFAHNTTLGSPTWRKEHPHIQRAFNNHMAGYHQGRPSWMDPGFYPLKERIQQGVTTDDKEVTIVDVGGGMGHDLLELRRKHPKLPGRFVLQDLPQVVEQIREQLDGVEVTVHNFFAEQPVKGQTYFSLASCHLRLT